MGLRPRSRVATATLCIRENPCKNDARRGPYVLPLRSSDSKFLSPSQYYRDLCRFI
jgi:hypothetical protein